MALRGKKVEAVAYIRTSSAANVGADKDSDKRQRAAIDGFAKRAGFVIIRGLKIVEIQSGALMSCGGCVDDARASRG